LQFDAGLHQLFVDCHLVPFLAGRPGIFLGAPSFL
jgi:hypothetical protein